ncbi:retrovirus-related Pol polyprotein from transposon 297 [Trichonephila clavipes]|nr:retrovirus-related Pol polyprotein from transposon 297 [Trichonephila clavipes]
MSDKALVGHIFVRLEPQVQDYVEVRNPKNTIQMLEVLAKFEERYSFMSIRGTRNSDNVEVRGWNERRRSSVDNNRGNWRNSEVVRRPSIGRNDYKGNYENSHQGNQLFESRNRFQKDDRRFNDRGYKFRNGSQKDDFNRGNHRNRGSNKPELTLVLYHEIDTGDNPPVVSRQIVTTGFLIINKEGIKTDDTKVRAIVEMKPPRNSKEMSKFLETQKAFDAVKAAVTKAPVLKLSDFKKPFELFTDASSIGVGAVLNQEQRPAVFASRTLSGAERNYTVTERECLAVVWALNTFRTYLGSLPIKVITDHAALTRLTHAFNEILGIRHVKTVVYRPQANRTERVNRDLVQMLANYINDQHDTWGRFLREFAYAIRTAVNETMGKPPAELLLGRKLITPF